MSSAAQIKASRANGACSRGPVTAEGKARACMNALRDGLRSQALILPWENAQEFESELDQLINDLQPRDGTELGLVHDIATAKWFHRRVRRAQFYRLKTAVDSAGDAEDEDVARTLDRLFSDAGRPLALYCISNAACGGPLTSSPEKEDDSQKPFALVKRLEASAKGCQAMIDIWREISARVVENLELQPQDRLRAIRMMRKQPADCALDERIWLIYAASFALHPAEKDHAFLDLKSELSTVGSEAFLDRVQSRWPLLIDASDTPGCKAALLDLIARNVAELESKRDAHLEHADERAASIAASLAYEDSPQGERLARHELACERRTHRCRDAFWKHRRETSRVENGGGRRAEEGGDGREVENVTDLMPQSVVAEDASQAQNKNLTSEPNVGDAASETRAMKEVAAASAELRSAFSELLDHVRGGSVPFGMPVAGDAKGLAAIEASILAGKPLLPPIS
jgi:hypothetical protein